MTHDPFPTEQPAIVTVGLLYANGPLHIGHLRGYVTGDVFARALRTLGQETVFVSGSDFHGAPIAVNASREAHDPEAYALDWHRKNKRRFPDFNIEFDRYGHTNEPRNQELTEEFVRAWESGGHVFEQVIDVAWDPKRDEPLPDRFVEGTCPYCGAQARGDECDDGCQRHLEPGELEEPRSVLTGVPAEYRSRSHKFLRLSDFQSYLDGFLDRLEGTENARNQPRSWVKNELRDWCITRDLDWGFPYPDDPHDRVLYVWVDAPVGYVSATKAVAEGSNEAFDWSEVWKAGHGEIIHIIGKDIIQQHSVYWPAMLRGANYAEPRAICATGFVTLDGRPLSTSRDHAVWADEYLQKGLHPDLLRYYLITESRIQGDLDFTWERFEERVNTKLVGHLGNFVHRSLLFAHRNWGGTPDVAPTEAVISEIQAATARFEEAVNEYQLRNVGEIPIELARFGNKYIQCEAPWQLIDENEAQAAQVISDCVQLCKAIAVVLEPVAPEKGRRIWVALDEPGSVHRSTLAEAVQAPPRAFDSPQQLFKRIGEPDPNAESQI